MAEEIKTPMSDFDKVGQVKDTAEFILLQDGVNSRVEAPVFEQKIIDKTTDRYLGKAETAESAKGNGGVAEGNELAVSGKDVYDYFTNGGGLNLFPNRKVPDFLVTDGDEAVKKIVNEDSTVTYKNNTSKPQSLRLAIYNVSNKTNYTFSVVVKNITGSYRIQIGSSGGTHFDVAQSQLYTDNGKKYISGSKDSEITYLFPNVLLNPHSEITIESAMFEKGGISNDWRYNLEENEISLNITNYSFGWISNSGLEIPDYYFITLKSNVIELKNAGVLNIHFKQITDEIKINAHYVLYDSDFKFIRRFTIANSKEIKLDDSKYYIVFIFDAKKLNGSSIDNYELNQNMFSLKISCKGIKSSSIKEVKKPYFNGIRNIYYDFKRNLNLNILSTNEPKPVKYQKDKVLGNGYIILPPNYTHEGKKTRLIIFGHGSANTEPSLGHYAPYVDYLVKQGYAVADCHAWGKLNGTYIGSQFFGSPTNYASYQSFYSFLIKNYNFYDSIFVFGKSQGGMQAYGLPYCTSIPILASCSLAGESSPVGNQHGYTDADRFACYEDMGFSGLEKDSSGKYIGEASVMYKKSLYDYEWTQERKDYYLKNKHRWMFFNPAMAGIINLPTKFEYLFPLNGNNYGADSDKTNQDFMSCAKVPRVPMICFVAKDDLYAANNRMKYQIEAGGGVFVMRLLPSGTENPHGQTDISGPKMDITTDLGYKMKDIPIAFVEMLEFFRQYE